MPYDPSPRAADVVARTRALLDEVAPPLERALLGGTPFRDLLPDLGAARARVKAAGLWNPHLPAAHGGVGLSLVEYAHVAEVLGRTPVGHFLFNGQAPDVGNVEVLAKYGSDAQKHRFLEPVVRGEARSCFAMTEPDHPGSNPVWLGTTARRDGDEWVIDGRKWFTSSADGAAFAIVMAVTEPEGRPHERASMIVVPTGTPGYRIVRNLPVMGEVGTDWASHAEVVFEGCRVPAENLLGPRGAGFRIAQERLGPGRIHHCMRWIGVCERVFDLMAHRLATRELAPGDLLGTRQFLQGYLAESRAEISAARLYVLDTAYKIDAVGPKAAAVELGGIKFFVAGVLDRVLDRAIQVYGGAGMLDDLPIAWWYRHERAARIYDGADEVHKANVARLILKGYGAEVR